MKEKKSFGELITWLNAIQSEGNISLTYGICDGYNTVIFDSWNDIHCVEAYINGFKELRKIPNIPEGRGLLNQVLEVRRNLKKDPTNLQYKEQLNILTTYISYTHHLAKLQHDALSINDFDVLVGFKNEYSNCCECSSIIRTTSIDSSDYPNPLYVDQCGHACNSCVSKGRFDDYILEAYANKVESIPHIVDLARLKLVQVNEKSYCNGVFTERCDSPRSIINRLGTHGIDTWFRIYSNKFDYQFDLFVKKNDLKKARSILGDVYNYPDDAIGTKFVVDARFTVS